MLLFLSFLHNVTRVGAPVHCNTSFILVLQLHIVKKRTVVQTVRVLNLIGGENKMKIYAEIH